MIDFKYVEWSKNFPNEDRIILSALSRFKEIDNSKALFGIHSRSLFYYRQTLPVKVQFVKLLKGFGSSLADKLI